LRRKENSVFSALSRFIIRRARLVLGVAFVLLIVSAILGGGVFGQLKGGGFDDPEASSTMARLALQEQLGRNTEGLLVLFTSRDGLTVDDPAYKQAVEATLARAEGLPYVQGSLSYYSTSAVQLVSNDRRSTYALLDLRGMQDEVLGHVKEVRPLLTSERLQVRLGGSPAVYEEMNEQISKDIAKAELLTFPIVAVLLVLIFGSLVAAALPLATGGLSILCSFLIIRIAANFFDISVFAVNIVTMLGLGLAIDYSLFLVSRFREELGRSGGESAPALRKTMQTAGRTVFFSGMTVAMSLMGLLVFPQMFLKSIGFGGMVAVLIAMLASITLLPAALYLLGPRINALSLRSLLGRKGNVLALDAAVADQRGFWYQLSQLVMRWPVVVLVLTLLPLLLAGLPFLRAEFSIPDARGLPEGSEGRTVAELLETEFPRNETQPIQVVVHTSGPADEAANLDALYDYARRLAAVPGVRRVDSLVTILGPEVDKAGYQAFYGQGLRDLKAMLVRRQFARGAYTVLSVVYNADPLSKEAEQLVGALRAVPGPGSAEVYIGGTTATVVDFLDSLGRHVPIAVGLIIGVIFILLFLMLGSLLVPLKAVLLNLLSLSASFGALVWIFQDGHLADLLGFTPLGYVDATEPVLIFAIAFGMSMDYEVFLLSRIKEQYDRSGDMTSSVAIGVQKTGRIITSAALLLGVVIGAFATGKIISIKQVGLGLSLAILLDATLVRMFLVPATMRLLGKYNWWAPAPLVALYHRLGMGEVEHEEAPEAAPVPAV
jgi:uncharacterized membrane protein YdfJ with MMPL/SSD domain